MELTLDQALQKGIEAHRAGQVQEAERLYTAILKAQPNHPDANHNLGLIAVSFNKAELALPLFKTALEANSKIEQFWLSYIDALIKANHLETVKSVLIDCRKMGFPGEKVDVLETQIQQITQPVLPKLSEKKKSLTLKEKRKSMTGKKLQNQQAKGKSASGISPSQLQLNNLMGHYQNGQYAEAEKLALSMTQQFPEHQFGWKVLGIVFGQTGRKSEAVNANQKAVALSPKDAEAHHNLGITLKEMDRLEEAEASYKRAIGLKPNFATVHNNLGITLKELGRLEDAEASFKQAIALKPDYAEAYNNMGNTLTNMGNLKAAIESYKHAIKIKPYFADFYNSMGIALKDMGDYEAAIGSYKHAIKIKPDFAKAYVNMGNAQAEIGDIDEAEAHLKKAIEIEPNSPKAYYNLGSLLFSNQQFEEAVECFKFSDHKDSGLRLLKCLYHLDKKEDIYIQLDYLTNQVVIHPMLGSFVSRSALRYGIERPNLFCKDPMSYVLQTDLSSEYDFEEIFVKNVKTILQKQLIPKRKQTLLTNGYQTSGNLFDLEFNLTEAIQTIIKLEIEKYLVYFKDSSEGLITNWPTNYSLKGWLVSMKNGGELQPHMHENGWISGSIYINVPPKLKAESGNLVVCIEEEKIVGRHKSNEKVISVVTGCLCLFPASLLHYTIPFESEEDRIVLAFDVVPKC